MMGRVLLCLMLVAATALSLPAAALNLLLNGGFEEPLLSWATGVSAGSTMGAWSVSTGTVYHMTNIYEANTAYEGQQYLQLMPGTWVQQQLATVPGQNYKVSFAMAGANIGTQSSHTMLAVWIANGAGTYVSQCTASDGVWGTHEFIVTAVTDHDQIAFGDVALYPWIDAVSVVPYTAEGTVTGRVYDASNPSIGAAHALVRSSSGAEVEADAYGVYTIGLAGDSTVDLVATHDDYYVTTVTGVHVAKDASTTVNFPATHLPVPVASDIVADTFTRPSGLALGSTEDASARPWVRAASEIGASISNDSLVLGQADSGPGCASPGFGVSLSGGYKPVDFDLSVDLTIAPGAWASVGYRQPIAGSFDNYGSTNPGYMVLCAADGSAIQLWRMGALATKTFDPPINWSVPHRLRVKVTGSNHQVFLGGTKVIDKMSSDKLTGGYLSLMRDTSRAQFDNLNVTRYSSNAGQISGTVTDTTNPAHVISGARIWLNTGEMTTSDANGVYRINRLARGTYNVVVTADGYYSKTYTGVTLADADSSAVRNLELSPLPAQTNVVTDDFNRADNWDSLGTTLAPQFLPWIMDPDQYATSIEGGKLRETAGTPRGASLDASFQPADLDVSASLATAGGGGWVGLAYRQQLPNTYDANRDQTASQAGYVAYFSDDGTQVVLWRNGAVAAANVSLTPQQEHILRVRAIGPHHEIWVDGVKQIDAWEQTKLAGGYVSIISSGEFATADDLRVGTYAPPAAEGQNLVQNGGFEEPTLDWVASPSAGSTIGPWLVSLGTVCHMTNIYEADTAYEGQQYLQLMPGSWVQQQLATVPGQDYKVSFAMAGANAGTHSDHAMQAVWIANGVGTYVSECTAPDGVWSTHEFIVTAVTDHDQIAFGDVALYPWIDAVSVVPYTAEGTVVGSVAAAKSLGDSSKVSLTGPIVTGVFSGCFYIEDEDRASGIKVVSPTAVNIGDAVTVQGAVSTADGERFVAASRASATPSGRLIKSVGLANRSFARTAGLSNIGLLTTLWGKVTEVSTDQTYCYVDDGTGASYVTGKVGLKVLIAGPKKPVANDYVSCTGVARISTVPVLQMRSDADLQIVLH